MFRRLFALFTLFVVVKSFPFGLPQGFQAIDVANNLGIVTDFDFLDANRIIVAQKSGQIILLKNGQRSTFLDLSSRVGAAVADRGLTSIRLHPDFPSAPFLYAAYAYDPTPTKDPAGPRTNRISRYTVNGDTASLDSELVIWGACKSVEKKWYGSDCFYALGTTHTVNHIWFGTDKQLYASFGEGQTSEGYDWNGRGWASDISEWWLHPMDVDVPGGKIFRMDPTTGLGFPDNPFYDGNPNSVRSRVWSVGYRNPWRGTHVPNSQDILMGQVGWFNFESLFHVTRGSNMGWPCLEGTALTWYNNQTVGCQNFYKNQGSKYPSWNPQNNLYTMNHNGAGMAIIGGVFFGDAYPEPYKSSYVFAEFVNGAMYYLPWNFGKQQAAHEPLLFARGGSDAIVSFVKNKFDGLVYSLGHCPSCSTLGVLRKYTYNANINDIPLPKKWTCVNGINTPLRLTDSGDVACLSTDGQGCFWLENAQACTTFVANSASDPNTKEFQCNSPQWKAKFGGTGYEDVNGWCAVGKKLLQPDPSIQPTPYKAPQAGQTSGQCQGKGPNMPPLPQGWSTVMFAAEVPGAQALQNGDPAYGPIEIDSSVGGPSAMDGTQMTIGGVRYTKGFGMMSPGKLAVPVGGFCYRFQAEVGIDDETLGKGEGEFIIRWNNQVGWNSTEVLGRHVRAGDAPLKIDLINLENINSITFEGVKIGDGTHLDWANARFYCGPDAFYLPEVTVTNPNPVSDVAIGSNVAFSGQAVDYTGYPIPVQAWTWYINLLHCQGDNCHTHYLGTYPGLQGGNFQADDHPLGGGQYFFYEIRLQVTHCGRTNDARRYVRVHVAKAAEAASVDGPGIASAEEDFIPEEASRRIELIPADKARESPISRPQPLNVE